MQMGFQGGHRLGLCCSTSHLGTKFLRESIRLSGPSRIQLRYLNGYPRVYQLIRPLAEGHPEGLSHASQGYPYPYTSSRGQIGKPSAKIAEKRSRQNFIKTSSKNEGPPSSIPIGTEVLANSCYHTRMREHPRCHLICQGHRGAFKPLQRPAHPPEAACMLRPRLPPRLPSQQASYQAEAQMSA